jgi:hypothetical protein
MAGMMTRDMMDITMCIGSTFAIGIIAQIYEWIFGGTDATLD